MSVFNFEFERTGFSDGAYGVVGRALAYAQKFEGDCKALASLLLGIHSTRELREFSSVDFEEVVMKNWEAGLGRQIDKLTRVFDLPSDVREPLESARRSRNEIAHEVCLGIQFDIETDSGRQRLVERISNAVRQIAEGHLVVLGGMASFNDEELPRKDYLDAYCDRVVEWVCSAEDDFS